MISGTDLSMTKILVSWILVLPRTPGILSANVNSSSRLRVSVPPFYWTVSLQSYILVHEKLGYALQETAGLILSWPWQRAICSWWLWCRVVNQPTSLDSNPSQTRKMIGSPNQTWKIPKVKLGLKTYSSNYSFLLNHFSLLWLNGTVYWLIVMY